MITSQKLHAVLKKAGLTKSKYYASGRVRGWGHSTEGYAIRKQSENFKIEHVIGHWSRLRDDDFYAYKKEQIEKYADALKAAGIASEPETNRYGNVSLTVKMEQ